MEIFELDELNILDINKANEPFEIIGILKPTFTNGRWTYTEELLDEPYIKSYPNDDCDYSDYINNPSKVIFLAYSEGICIGQIILRKEWNQYAFVEDICVSKTGRGQGVGTALMKRATGWAESVGMKGLALETQDNNLWACRFYAKCGFVIGAVNTMIYKNFEKPWSNENAIMWYKKF